MSIFTRLQPALLALSILAPGTPSGQLAWAQATVGCSETPVAATVPDADTGVLGRLEPPTDRPRSGPELAQMETGPRH